MRKLFCVLSCIGLLMCGCENSNSQRNEIIEVTEATEVIEATETTEVTEVNGYEIPAGLSFMMFEDGETHTFSYEQSGGIHENIYIIGNTNNTEKIGQLLMTSMTTAYPSDLSRPGEETIFHGKLSNFNGVFMQDERVYYYDYNNQEKYLDTSYLMSFYRDDPSSGISFSTVGIVKKDSGRWVLFPCEVLSNNLCYPHDNKHYVKYDILIDNQIVEAEKHYSID